MAGVERVSETPQEYALTKIDPIFNAGFHEFMTVYLRLKYGRGTLREGDAGIINKFGSNAGSSIRRTKGFFKVALNYFNIVLASRYFLPSDNNESEN